MSTLTDNIADLERRVEAGVESVVNLEGQFHDITAKLSTERDRLETMRSELKDLRSRERFLRSRLSVVPKALDLRRGGPRT